MHILHIKYAWDSISSEFRYSQTIFFGYLGLQVPCLLDE